MVLSAILVSVRPSQSTFSVYKTKTKPFDRFARKARITDADLWKAADIANRGIIDADLGGGVIKQRIARAGEGKSGGSRTIIAFRKDDRAIYVFGFEKKDQANIDRSDLEAFRELAQIALNYAQSEIENQLTIGALFNIHEPEIGHV
jgi:hypothetical protein